ncbi:triosephosphate isomerase (TIM) [Angomonas deanei]|nr:triosephosphate isomerase (TIM) [Angomonas deanei]|eukprot:EPY42088.1 triosephosphate isomerase (TIM) [Angomonas deanei]
MKNMISKYNYLKKKTKTFFLVLGGINDGEELRLQRSTTDKETVNVLLLVQRGGILPVDRTTVEDAKSSGDIGANLVLNVATDDGVHLLRLLGGGDLAGADGPDGLVGEHNLAPGLLGELGGDRLDLSEDHLRGLARLALLQGLANAGDHVETLLVGIQRLLGHNLVGLPVVLTALGVAEDEPVNVKVLEDGHADLTGEGAALRDGVLGGDHELGVGEGALHEGDVDEGGGDHALDVVVDLVTVEDADELLNGGLRAVALPVGGGDGLRLGHDR